jgi:putative membrane protein
VSHSDTTVDDASEREYGIKSLFIVYLKGLAMGAADAVPGVSGGTIALIAGIYERLITSVTSLDPSVVLQIPSLYKQEKRAAFWEKLIEMDVPFLIALGLGMGTAIVLLARMVEIALETVPGPTFAFFFGLIGASAIVLFEREWLRNPGAVAAAVVGFTAAFLIAGETATETAPHTAPIIFGAGTLAVAGMILPGISGAFILLLLGQYDYMTGSLNRFIDSVIGLATGGSVSEIINATGVVMLFISGAFVGLFTIAYLVRAALERYRIATLAFLVSLMVGALRYPVIQIGNETEAWTPAVLAGLVGAGLVGFGTILCLDRYTEDLDYATETNHPGYQEGAIQDGQDGPLDSQSDNRR